MTHEQYLNLERSFTGIRDERNFRANTATRIGTAFLELLRNIRTGEFDEVSFNSVSNQPAFLKGLRTFGDIILGDYIKGLQGGIITSEAFAELKDLWVREHLKAGDGTIHHDAAGKPLPAFEVDGDAVFSGNLSSPDFISGFFGGLGWALQKKEYVNAAGQTETKYSFEVDNLTVRNTLRVYELVVSQLLGENDNYVFAAMMEVDHYDPMTGKVWLSTNGGKSYMNFRKGDYIMVQRFQPGNDAKSGGDGYIVKSYELKIIDFGSGGEKDPKDENGDRLDWVRFSNFATQMVFDEEDPAHKDADYIGTYHTEEEISGYSDPVFIGPEMLITKGDTFCRVDNETDPERKGIMSIMSVGANTPYMDVHYGLKTDPERALKSRIGNLEGIRTDLFGWLQGFGAYIANLYSVGKFINSQTGESMESRIEATNESLKSLYKETLYDISDADNKVSNGFFQKDLEDWSVVDDEGDDMPEEAEMDCVRRIDENGRVLDSNEDDREAVDADWNLENASGNEESDGLVITDGTVYEDGDGNSYTLPFLLNGQLIQQKRLIAELSEMEGVKVLHLCHAGIAQDFDKMKANGTHKRLTDEDESGSQPNYEEETYGYWAGLYPDWSPARIQASIDSAKAANKVLEDALTATEDEADTLFIGIRILPLTSGTLRVGFLSGNGSWSWLSSGFSKSLSASRQWMLVQGKDNPDEPWYYPLDTDETAKTGRLFIGYSGECYIRFVALQNDPFDNIEHTYRTLLEQTSRRIRMQAAYDEEQLADFVIQHNAIVQRVTTDESQEKRRIKDLLGITINSDGTYSFPDNWVPDGNGRYDFSSWRIQTAGRLDDLLAKWDEKGNLIGYSHHTQTADYISDVLAASGYDYPAWIRKIVNLINKVAEFTTLWDSVKDAPANGGLYAADVVRLKSKWSPVYDLLDDCFGAINRLSSEDKEGYELVIGLFNFGEGTVSRAVDYVDRALDNLDNGVDIASNNTYFRYLRDEDVKELVSVMKQLSDAIASVLAVRDLAARVKEVTEGFEAFQEDLDDAIRENYPGHDFVSWVSDTALSSVKIKAILDGNGEITAQSTWLQTAEVLFSGLFKTEGFKDYVSEVKEYADGIETSVREYAKGYSDGLKEAIDEDIAERQAALEELIGVVDESAAYSASWITQKSKYIDIVAANWDEDGNLLNNSSITVYGNGILLSANSHADEKFTELSATVDGIGSRVGDAEGNISTLDQTATRLQTQITDNKSAADTAFDNINDVVIPRLITDIGNAQDSADYSATWINQNKDRITLISGQFDENGNLSNTSGLVTGNGSFTTLFAAAVEDNDIVSLADLSVYVQYDETTKKIVSGIKLTANQLDFAADDIIWKLRNSWKIQNSNKKDVLYFDANGNLQIAGQITANQVNFETTGTQNTGDINNTGDIINSGDIKLLNTKKIYIKDNVGSGTYISSLTMDTSNNLILGEGQCAATTSASQNLHRTYIRGHEVVMQYGISGDVNVGAKLDYNGVFNVNKLKIGSATLEWDDDNSALKINQHVYSTGSVAAYGAGSTSGGGGSDINISTFGVLSGKTLRLTISGQTKDADLSSMFTGIGGNTAGALDNHGTKLYLIGASEQAANPVTNTNSGCYIDANGYIFSNSSKTVTESSIGSLGTNIGVAKANSAIFVSDASGGKKVGLNADSNRGVYDWTASKWLVGSNGTKTFLMLGNVGIGKDSPDYKLHVSGNAAMNSLILGQDDGTGTYSISTKDSDACINLSAQSVHIGASSIPSSVNVEPKFYVNGIGYFSGDLYSNGKKVLTEGSGGGSGAYLPLSGGTLTGGITFEKDSYSMELKHALNSDSKMLFGFYSKTNNDWIFYYNQDTKRAHFGSKTNLCNLFGTNVVLYGINSGTENEGLRVTKAGNVRILNRASVGTDPDDNYTLKVSGSSLFVNNVGIGGYNSGYKLYVSGTASISQTLSVYGMEITKNNGVYEINTDDIRVNTDADWYGYWKSASDINKKDWVENIEVSVEDVARTPIFAFTWKDKPQRGIYMGTSAQYIQTVFPHAVDVLEDGTLAMDYGATALAAAVMTARTVLTHEQRIAALEAENERLRTEIEQLKAA